MTNAPSPSTELHTGCAHRIEWQPVSALPFRCSLSSDSREPIDLASVLFQPWLRPASVGDTCKATSAEWIVEPCPCDDGEAEKPLWRVRGREDAAWRGRELPALLTQIEYDAVLRLWRNLEPEFLGFHGALLSKNGKGVLILGARESGKSSLSCALWNAGWDLLNDDCVIMDSELRAHPSARRVSLRHGSRDLWEPSQWSKLSCLPSTVSLPHTMLFHPHELTGRAAPLREALNLTAIVILGRQPALRAGSGSAQASLGRVPAAQAALSLLSHSTLLWAYENANREALQRDWLTLLLRVTPLAETVPMYDLARDDLSRMVERVERVARGGPF